jgi:hypothetical protein
MEMCAFIGKSHEFFMNLKKAGFTDDLIQEVINSKNNALAKKMYASIVEAEIKTNAAKAGFEKLTEFEITIPENFDFDAFRHENEKGFYYFEPALIGKNFKSDIVSEAGKKKIVEIYRLKGNKTSEECLDFIASQNGQLPNAQGLAIVWQQAKEKLPQGKGIWIFGFDQKANLFLDSVGRHRVPSLARGSDGGWHFRLGSFGVDWNSGHCLLFFRDCA